MNKKVLDFVNKAEDIHKAFQPYYQGTVLSEGADPNMVYQIYKRVETYRLFDDNQVNEFANIYYSGRDEMEKLNYYLLQCKKSNFFDKFI